MDSNTSLVDIEDRLDFLTEFDRKDVADCFKSVITSIYDSAKKQTRLEPKLITIIRDLEDIRLSSPASHKVILISITSYPSSYLTIARKIGITKQAVHKTIKELSAKYDWIDTMLKMRSQYQLTKGNCPISGNSFDPAKRFKQ
jgi:predicted DNA-binding protein YlxM (UPF0122 family)